MVVTFFEIGFFYGACTGFLGCILGVFPSTEQKADYLNRKI